MSRFSSVLLSCIYLVRDRPAQDHRKSSVLAGIMKQHSGKIFSSASRRQTIGLGFSAAVFGVFPIWTTDGQRHTAEELRARFLRWSRTATGFSDITPDAARTCLELLLRSGFTPDGLSELEPDSYRGTPLEKRVLETWYTGVFTIEGSADLRSFATTLMWRAAGLDPPPSSCNGPPDRWASLPSNI